MVSGLTDVELAAEMRLRAPLGDARFLVVANKFSSRVLVAAPGAPTKWDDLGCGDIEGDAKKLLEAAAKKSRLDWLATSASDPASVDLPAASPPVPAGVTGLRAWCRERDKLTGTSGGQRHPNSTQLSTKVDSEAVLTAGAKALGVDVAPAADCGIADAVPLGPQVRWIAENLEALKSSNAYVEQHGLPLAKHHNS